MAKAIKEFRRIITQRELKIYIDNECKGANDLIICSFFAMNRKKLE
ncbi:hypothetical protein [Oribacterium sp. C9]|nr:hypothetical protein [Oribacterium sp. C9]